MRRRCVVIFVSLTHSLSLLPSFTSTPARLLIYSQVAQEVLTRPRAVHPYLPLAVARHRRRLLRAGVNAKRAWRRKTAATFGVE